MFCTSQSSEMVHALSWDLRDSLKPGHRILLLFMSTHENDKFFISVIEKVKMERFSLSNLWTFRDDANNLHTVHTLFVRTGLGWYTYCSCL